MAKRMVEVVLNQQMRIISGTTKASLTDWLPVLQYIMSPHLCRQGTLSGEDGKIQNNPQVPIQSLSIIIIIYCIDRNKLRYLSLSLSLVSVNDLRITAFSLADYWRSKWEEMSTA